MQACNLNATDSKKTILDLIIQPEVLFITVQKNVLQICKRSICG